MLQLWQGRIIGGKYRLDRLLGRGGMGSVWLAQHLQLQAPVAVKFMDAAFASSEGARRRFEREARAAAQLRSPHVVHVHDHGVDGDLPFIVMEVLEGEDLGARLKRERRISPAALAPIVKQVAKALQRAHDAGIVHRDLKPGNVFLAKDGEDEMVKILDFGVAKVTLAGDGEETITGALLGSAHYMSPEQAKGDRSVDHRSDLWSLGVILFRALTGKKPFHGSMGEAIIDICTNPIPIPSEVAPDLGAAVDRFFERALARDPDQRFQNMRELEAAFRVLAATSTEPPLPLPRSAAPTDPPDAASTSSLSSHLVAGAPDGATSVPDVTAPPLFASLRAPSSAESTSPKPATLPNAEDVAPPFRRGGALAWGAAAVTAMLVVAAAFALVRGASRAPAEAAPIATEPGATAAAAAPPPMTMPDPVPTGTVDPGEPRPIGSSEPAAMHAPQRVAAPTAPARPSKPGATTKQRPSQSANPANDEPNFGY